MARGAFGFKTTETDIDVAYGFADIGEEYPQGEVTIPFEDPESWTVAGTEARPWAAGAVYSKAIRTFNRTGAWPARVVIAT